MVALLVRERTVRSLTWDLCRLSSLAPSHRFSLPSCTLLSQQKRKNKQYKPSKIVQKCALHTYQCTLLIINNTIHYMSTFRPQSLILSRLCCLGPRHVWSGFWPCWAGRHHGPSSLAGRPSLMLTHC